VKTQGVKSVYRWEKRSHEEHSEEHTEKEEAGHKGEDVSGRKSAVSELREVGQLEPCNGMVIR
jgi:hypothetical protein